MSSGAGPRKLNKREAQDRLIDLVASGMLLHSAKSLGRPGYNGDRPGALDRVGRSSGCYYEWRGSDPAFAQRIDAVRAVSAERPQGRDMRSINNLPEGVELPVFRKAYFDNTTPPHHQKMIDALNRTRPGEITMVLAFPEAAKTTLLTDRICWLLGRKDPDHRICVISEGRDLAAKVVRQVQTRMTDEVQFADYIDECGPFKAESREFAKPWNANFMSILKSHHDEKDPSLEARGAGSKLYGGRYDWIALDDIQSSETLNATPNLMTYLRTTVITRPTLNRGWISIWGSRVGDGDIYERLVEEDMVDHLVKVPALSVNIPREEHYTVKMPGRKIVVNPHCAAVPTWDRYSLKDLAVRREKVKERIWARTYMQSDLDTFGQTFTEEMIDGVKDPNLTTGMLRGTGVMCSVDPALETGTCAYVACGFDADHLWVIDAHTSRDTHRTEDILDHIALWSARYRPQCWVVEQNNFQKALVRDDRLEALGRKFRFEPLAHQTSRNKYDPVIGIAMMPSSFIDKEISIPWREDAQEKMGPLCEELRNWRPKKSGRDLKQDLVVALWFIWIRWQAEREGLTSVIPPLWTPPSWMRGVA